MLEYPSNPSSNNPDPLIKTAETLKKPSSQPPMKLNASPAISPTVFQCNNSLTQYPGYPASQADEVISINRGEDMAILTKTGGGWGVLQ